MLQFSPQITLSFTRRRLTCVYSSGPPEPKINHNCSSSSPRPVLALDATPQTRSVLGGPRLRRENVSDFQKTSRRKGSAHTSHEGRGLRPPARGAPPDEPAEFSSPGAISRRSKISYRAPEGTSNREGGRGASGDTSIYICIYVCLEACNYRALVCRMKNRHGHWGAGCRWVEKAVQTQIKQ